MPTVSVVIPTYNRATKVKKAIQSVLNQSYQDFEIIIIDDGSEDGTEESIKGFSDKIIYVHQENKGSSNARNHGLRIAQGKYIAFLDSDDEYLPGKLIEQVAIMDQNPDVVLSHTSYLRAYDNNNRINKVVNAGVFSGNVYPCLILRCPIATPTVMVRKEALKNYSFNEDVKIGEDVILWVQLARHSRILGIKKSLTCVNVSENSAAFNPQAQIIGMRNLLKYTVLNDKTMSVHRKAYIIALGYLVIAYNFALLIKRSIISRIT